MQCSVCGAENPAGGAFCIQCGAATSSGGTAATPPDLRKPGVTYFDFDGSALGLFGRAVVLGISLMLIVPAPWAYCWFMRWFYEKTRISDGTTPSFSGTPGSVWVLTTLYGAVMILDQALPHLTDEPSTLFAVWIAVYLVMFLLGWKLMLWLCGNTELGGRRLHFDGRFFSYLGWFALTYVSVVTIIGWAWVMEAFYGWLSIHVKGADGDLRFVGKGHQILWRTIVYILFCLPVVTIPWAMLWLMRWLLQQFELVPRSTAEQDAAAV